MHYGIIYWSKFHYYYKSNESYCVWKYRFFLIPEKEYAVKTKIIQADFSQGESIYKEIQEELKDIQVGILGMQLILSIINGGCIFSTKKKTSQ